MAESIVSCPNCGRRNRVPARSEGVPRCAVCHHLLPWLVRADAASFDEEIAASVPVLVDFWAPWCGPCKWVEPVIDAVAREKAGELKVVRLDVDTAPDVAARHQVQSIPALILFRDGEEVDRLVGAASKPQLEGWLERHLGAPAEARA